MPTEPNQPADERIEAVFEAAMRDAWDEICSDTGCHPLDIRREGRKLFYEPNHWTRFVGDRLRAAISASEAHLLARAGEIGERLRERYTADPVPPCPVCGAELSIQAAGGGQATVWACGPWENDPDDPGHLRVKAGRSGGDEHYEKSRRTQFRNGDSDVLELLAIIATQAAEIERKDEALRRIEQPVFVAEPAGMADSAWRVALNERINIARAALSPQEPDDAE